jgi:D-xylose 1-dehydrogenase (NADP+, D-xylono-1,5-lactone-forming)
VDVRWGFLGAGQIARVAMAPAVRAATGAVLQAVAARDVGRAAALEPAGRAYDSYDALLSDDAVDAVYISLANDAHVPWTVRALEAGKHVLCEKPFGRTAAEVSEVMDAARAADRLAVEAMWYRWHPRTRAAEAAVAGIGPLRDVSVGFTYDGVPTDDYRLDPARGGGVLLDVGCYAVSAMLWAVGWAPVSDVSAQLHIGETGVDLVADAVVSFRADEVDSRAQLHCSMIEPKRQWFVVRGDVGELELPPPVFGARETGPVELWVSNGAQTRRTTFPPVPTFALMVEQVSSAIRGEGGWVQPLEESLAVMRMLDAIRAAARSDGRLEA